MQYYAREVAGTVAEIIKVKAGDDIGELYPKALIDRLVEVGATVKEGWVRDGDDFVAPPPFAPPQRSRFTFLEFMDMFTEDEQLAIAGAAMTNASTKLWYDRAVGATYIDTADERLGAGLIALVDAELISAERRARVLQGLPPQS